MSNILFIVENDYFPRDARVYNECMTLSEKGYKCYVIAPKQKNEKFKEFIENKIICYRYPHFEAKSLYGLPFEYVNALIWIFIYGVIISLIKRISVIHVANPPDFLIPILSPLKIFKVKFIFDVHDLASETFNTKVKNNRFTVFISKLLEYFTKLSIICSTNIITTNNSIKEIIEKKYKNRYKVSNIIVIRNSNKIRYRNLGEINKKKSSKCIIGYFGVINDDYASGYQNIIELAFILLSKKFNCNFEIIGDGGGLIPLKNLVVQNKLDNYFTFYGFIPLNNSFEIIKNFDFGLVPWPNVPKNNLHTAMKVMDYMCCGVPVCSLNLKEQIISTGGIGIHTNTFEEMAEKIIKIYNNKSEYEELRKKTLEHFNNNLSWEIQGEELLRCYNSLFPNKKTNEINAKK